MTISAAAKAMSKRAHESMTPEQRVARAKKAGRAAAAARAAKKQEEAAWNKLLKVELDKVLRRRSRVKRAKED